MQAQIKTAEYDFLEASVQRSFDELRTLREIGLDNVFTLLDSMLKMERKIRKGERPELARDEAAMFRDAIERLCTGMKSDERLAKYLFILPTFRSVYDRVHSYVEQNPPEWDVSP